MPNGRETEVKKPKGFLKLIRVFFLCDPKRVGSSVFQEVQFQHILIATIASHQMISIQAYIRTDYYYNP